MPEFSGGINSKRSNYSAKGFVPFLLISLFLLFGSVASATTYYLTASGAGSAQTPGSWNTIAGGGGTAATNFTTEGDIFNIPSGVTATFGGSATFAAGVTLQVDGSISINGNGAILTIDGIISFTSTNSTQVSLAGAQSGQTFALGTSGKLITVNVNGVSGTNCSLPASASKATVTLPTTANYELSGATQASLGLPTTVNNLTLSGSGVKTITGKTVNGILSMEGTATASGTPTYGSSATLQYKGSAAQTVGSEFPATWAGTGGVIIDNINGVSLTTSKVVNATVNINSGFLSPSAAVVISGSGTLTGSGTVQVTRTTATADFNSQYTITNKTLTNLTVNYTATSAQTISATNYGNLTISGSRGANSVTLASGTIGVSGTFNPTATFGGGAYITTGNTVSFNGSTGQTIPAFTFNSLTLSNSAGATLGGDITVNGTLTFSSGIITTSTNKVILGSAATISGAGTGKYINGNLRRNIPATNNFSAAFDIGDATNYTPVTVLFSGTPGGGGQY